MSEAKLQSSWTWEAFLDWEADQQTRFELVKGRVHVVGGGTAEHDTIANNLRAALLSQLRGKRARPHGPHLKVRVGNHAQELDLTGTCYYPDALIDCGPRLLGALYAQEPVAVFEVLSKRTGWIDQSLKLRDYDATPSIRTYVLISQDDLRAMVYTREADGRLGIRSAVVLSGEAAVIEIPDLGVVLPFSVLYEGAELTPARIADFPPTS